MSAAEAIEYFVEPMRRRFTVPSGIDPDLFSADLAEALGGYSNYQLECAANFFRDNRTTRTFPTIAECRQACERYAVAAPQATVSRPYETDAMKRSLEHTERQKRLRGIQLSRCALGRQAHEQGWLGRLIEFAADYDRLPNEREVQEIRAKQREADESLKRLQPPVAGSTWSFNEQAALYDSFKKMRQTMIEKAYRDVFGFIEAREAAA